MARRRVRAGAPATVLPPQIQPQYCNPPYVHGVGGWCGCDCKCCPPCTCSQMLAVFSCGSFKAKGSAVPCGSCYPINSPDVFYLEARKIADGTCQCQGCASYNGFYYLYRLPGLCEWQSLELATCPVTGANVPRWRLVNTNGFWYVIMGGSNHDLASWTIPDASLNCDGKTTNRTTPGLQQLFADPDCQVGQAYISIQPDCRCSSISSTAMSMHIPMAPGHPKYTLPIKEQPPQHPSWPEGGIPVGIPKWEDRAPDPYGIGIKVDMPPMPEFSRKPIMNKKRGFHFPVNTACSVPCEQITIQLTGSICCFEFKNNEVYAVGCGTVTALANPNTGKCGYYTPYLQRWGECDLSPSAYYANSIQVQDGDMITITLVSTKEKPTQGNPMPAPNQCCPCCFLYWSNPCAPTYRLSKFRGRLAVSLNPELKKRRAEMLKAHKAFQLRQVRRIQET